MAFSTPNKMEMEVRVEQEQEEQPLLIRTTWTTKSKPSTYTYNVKDRAQDCHNDRNDTKNYSGEFSCFL